MNDTLIRRLQEIKLDEAIVYHVAPVSQRASILKHGLNPLKASYDISTSGKEIYVFKDVKEAEWYKEYQETSPIDGVYEKFDIYKVEIDDTKLQKDYTLTSDGDDEQSTSHSLQAPVLKDKIKLLKYRES